MTGFVNGGPWLVTLSTMLCAAAAAAPAPGVPDASPDQTAPAPEGAPEAPSPLTPSRPLAAPDRPADRLDVGALPLLNFNQDNGVGLGLNGALFWRKEGYRPYAYALRAQVFFTSAALQDHRLTLDAPKFLGSPYRLDLSLRYARAGFLGYYGLGNEPPVPPPTDPRWTGSYFTYDWAALESAARVQRALGNSWHLGGTYSLFRVRVEAQAGTLLYEQPHPVPPDGYLGLLSAFLRYDSRDVEASPTRGVDARLTFGLAAPWLGSSWPFVETRLATSVFFPLKLVAPSLILAARLDLGLVTQGAPVHRLYVLGGSLSLRGVRRNRYAGNAGALLNTELRSQLVRLRPGGHYLDLWAVAFVDLGRVWAFGVDNGPFPGLHAGTGAGVRVAWEEDYVVRADLGWSGETPRLYIEFGQAF